MAERGALYVLDGNSLIFRAFFALPIDLATTTGQVTNAVHGFTSMLVMLLRDNEPSGVAVAFDRPEPTFRDAVVADYKGNRPEMPDLLVPQFGMVRSVLSAMRIATFELVGYEADDILATMATRARDLGRDVVVVTGDRDTFQLVEDPHVKVMYTRRGMSDTVVYDEAGIIERHGVPPKSYPMLAALRGDTSDNLPGVPGVGEKTAAKLVAAYGDLDGIFAHLDDLSPKLRQNLADHEEQVRRNAEVITLVRDVPLDVAFDELTPGDWDVEGMKTVFGELELRSVWQRLAPIVGSGMEEELPRAAGAGAPPALDIAAVTPAPVGDAAEARAVLAALGEGGHPVALAPVWAGVAGRSPLAGMAALAVTEADDGEQSGQPAEGPTTASAVPSPIWLDEALMGSQDVLAALGELAGSEGPGVVAHGVKELMRTLAPAGVDITGLVMDTAVAAYLLDPSSGRYRLEEVAEQQLSLALDDTAAAASAGQLALDPGANDELPTYAARCAVALSLLLAPLRRALAQAGLEKLHDEVELPLVRVLARMEVTGIRVDAHVLRRIADELRAECQHLEKEIHDLAGEPFNVNSTPQLRTVLYDRLGLTPGRKTKTGFSTDAATLEKLRGQHPIVDTLLRYREVEKLRSTYGESLLAEVGPDGRIHATFHQTVARTGRLSSDRPNLHNIPVRSEEGRQMRKAFIPADGCLLLVADYDQIELRVIAHVSKDPGLVTAFAEARDIHRTTAARVFGVAPVDVTVAQRSRAKMVSYGLAYGMEAHGLAQRLSIEPPEAQEILAAYFAAFPAVRAFMDRTVVEARSRGYTETLFGRRRPLPDLHSPNRTLRMAAERQAMNAGIQGLAADLFKVALVRLDHALEERRLASRLVLQVHDEVLVEVPEAERDTVGALVPDVMAGVAAAADLVVPLEVSASWGTSWADAKG
ncbi:MAG TPA: DNA polymerase I [Acidimicrobiales bacterium]|nr:DNA polymerase I [Acidimicrobiales bacterium]